MHPHTSPYSALSAEAEPISEVMSQDESIMPNISGYIRERVKVGKSSLENICA